MPRRRSATPPRTQRRRRAGTTPRYRDLRRRRDQRDRLGDRGRRRPRRGQGDARADTVQPLRRRHRHGAATGTIVTKPKAWMVRFGRAIGSQVIDALDARLDAQTTPHVTPADVNVLGETTEEVRIETDDPFGRPESAGNARRDTAQTISGNELVLQSAFHVSSRGEGAGAGPARSRASWSRRAAGRVAPGSTPRRAKMQALRSTLTGVYPYVRVDLEHEASASRSRPRRAPRPRSHRWSPRRSASRQRCRRAPRGFSAPHFDRRGAVPVRSVRECDFRSRRRHGVESRRVVRVVIVDHDRSRPAIHRPDVGFDPQCHLLVDGVVIVGGRDLDPCLFESTVVVRPCGREALR